ncbi:MAG TPA: hypothetical protein VN700_01835 [Vicinamibacterales bacterium]|nr:hypothetical protein [Vicinamibacterales bacterium]
MLRRLTVDQLLQRLVVAQLARASDPYPVRYAPDASCAPTRS